MFYAHSVLALGSPGSDASEWSGPVLVGSAMVFMTLLSVFLLRYFGRKTLLLIGMVGMGVFHVVVGVFFELGSGTGVVIGTVAYVGLYATSLGPVLWVYLPEVLPPIGQSAATFLNWLFTIVVTFTTPIMLETPGPSWTFWLYAAFCLTGAVYV